MSTPSSTSGNGTPGKTDFDTLKSDMKALREDLATLLKDTGSLAAQQAKAAADKGRELAETPATRRSSIAKSSPTRCANIRWPRSASRWRLATSSPRCRAASSDSQRPAGPGTPRVRKFLRPRQGRCHCGGRGRIILAIAGLAGLTVAAAWQLSLWMPWPAALAVTGVGLLAIAAISLWVGMQTKKKKPSPSQQDLTAMSTRWPWCWG